MATSITASNSTATYSSYFLSDANYTVTATFPSGSGAVSGSTTSLFFPNLCVPTVGKVIIQLSNTALTNSSGSVTNYVGLQESVDNVNWNNIAVFTSSLLPITDNGSLSSPAGSVQVFLSPLAKPYLRAQATVVSGGQAVGGITGSYTLSALFATC